MKHKKAPTPRLSLDARDAIGNAAPDTFRLQIGRSLGRALPTVIAFLPENAFTRLLSSACATIRPSSVPPPPAPRNPDLQSAS